MSTKTEEPSAEAQPAEKRGLDAVLAAKAAERAKSGPEPGEPPSAEEPPAPAPSEEPPAVELPSVDVLNDAFRDMARRRKTRLSEAQGRIAELEQANARNEAWQREFNARKPKIEALATRARETEQQLWTLKAERDRLAHQIETAKARGVEFEEDQSFNTQQQVLAVQRRLDELTNILSGLGAPRPAPAPSPAPAQPPQAAARQQQPAFAPPGQAPTPGAQGGVPTADALMAYWREHFAPIVAEVPTMAPFQQAAWEVFWNSGGTISVEDACEQFLDVAWDAHKRRLEQKASQQQGMPRQPPQGGNVAETQRRAGTRPPLQPEKPGQKMGLDAVAAAHKRDKRRWAR